MSGFMQGDALQVLQLGNKAREAGHLACKQAWYQGTGTMGSSEAFNSCTPVFLFLCCCAWCACAHGATSVTRLCLRVILWCPGTQVQLQATVTNTGNVKWTAGAALTLDPVLTGVNCSTAASEAGADATAGDFTAGSNVLLVGNTVICQGTYAFTQADFEGFLAASTTKPFKVSLPAGAPAGWTATDTISSTARSYSQVPVPAAVMASLSAAFGDCTAPSAASGESGAAAAGWGWMCPALCADIACCITHVPAP